MRKLLLAAAVVAGIGSVALALRATRPSTRGLPVFGSLRPFTLVDQTGKPVTQADLLGAVHVVNFIFTSCPTVCPRLTSQMARLQERTAAMPVRFVSFTVDPVNDTPERLREFAARYGADGKRWRFVTGDPEALRELVVKGFMTAMEPAGSQRAPEAVLHGESFVVLDAKGRLRAFRPAASERDLDEIIAVARELVANPERIASR